MTAEAIVYAALETLANGQVFPDVAPAKTPAPWITYQAVGGQAFNTVDGETPALRNARMQISVYATTRLGAALIMEQAFQALVNPAVKAVPIGGPVSGFEKDTLLYASTLDFSITY
ncbi:DUF3168 domain-containing protein [Pararobbsia alpina]|uniref:DUF3168 domain-containing protein n=1 Tax=Pararobbsia alpina TaxID=621374 RepID=A0A6S7CQS9_9BURK|nr:DUF3168 domain-containing protein [Pararobbsia alpina]CAB3795509.1 hypothetical protein LMG28138_03894 [Pararobbsia alpina]